MNYLLSKDSKAELRFFNSQKEVAQWKGNTKPPVRLEKTTEGAAPA